MSIEKTATPIAALILFACFVALPAHGACNKSCLSDITEQFLEAKITGNLNQLPLADDLRATSNGSVVELGQGESWEPGITVVNRHTFLDPRTQSIVSFGTIAGGWPEVEGRRTWWHYAVRLTVDADGNIVEVEEHARSNQHPENVPRPFPEAALYGSVLPEDERVPAAEMIRVANTYLDGITYGDGADVLFGPDCQRSELGGYRTNQIIETWEGESFNPGLPSSCRYRFTVREEQFRWRIENRRFYIVDEPRGVLVGIFQFYQHGDDGNPALTVPEAFKIVNGRISYKWAPAHGPSEVSGWPEWDRPAD